jgi:aspartate/methionine/tyrosine aminotransferase
MSPAEQINTILQTAHPAAYRALSAFGRQIYLPKGVPLQAAQAANARWNATIGQCTDDDGEAMPLAMMAERLAAVDPKEAFLYTPQGGRKDLRAAWKEHILSELDSGERAEDIQLSLPVTCSGLTHGLSVAAELFIDTDTQVFLPTPRWGNYDLIFGIRGGGQIHNYDFMSPSSQGMRLNVSELIAQLKAALAAGAKKLFLVLNFPNNPTGYNPTVQEADELVLALSTLFEGVEEEEKPMITILLDEAYHGMEWEDDCCRQSLFFRLSRLDQEQFLICKVDGATKEMFFFGGRIGFLSFAANPAAAEVLEEKVIACIRSSISALSSIGQALLYEALLAEDLVKQQEQNRQVVRERYQVLKRELAQTKLSYWPFNSAFFAVVNVTEDPELVRHKLLERGVGVVSIPSAGALRISYSTVPAAMLPELVQILEDTILNG